MTVSPEAVPPPSLGPSPVLLLFWFLQKQPVSGLTRGAVKG